MHIPVLLQEVLQILDPKPGKRYIDATVGGGGHTIPLLEAGAEVLGIDRDPSVIASIAKQSLGQEIASFATAPCNDKLVLVQGNFADLKQIAEQYEFTDVDGVLFDLGLGSHQLDEPGRGFSFQKEGPLDMRFDQKGNLIAAEVVNRYPEKELVRIFQEYGEERRMGRRIARAIVEIRKTQPIETTTELFEVIKKALPAKLRFRAGDTARRIFQSLRIGVNDELTNLEKALPQALDLVRRGGRLAVISFHSIEDRIVKEFFRDQAKGCICPPEFPICRCNRVPTLKIFNKKPTRASETEINNNPRSKSAKLRAAAKV